MVEDDVFKYEFIYKKVMPIGYNDWMGWGIPDSKVIAITIEIE